MCICNTFRIAQYLEEVASRWDRCKDVASCVLLCAYTKALAIRWDRCKDVASCVLLYAYTKALATRWDRCKDVASCVLLCAYTKATINEFGTHIATQFFCEYMEPWCVKVQTRRVCCTTCTRVFFAVMKHIIGPLCSEMTI
jgi:hypothetical protein